MDYSASYQPTLPPEAGIGLLAIFGLIPLLIFLTIYVYFAVCLMVIARKTATANSWFAWVPILNMILILQIAKKPLWWLILFLIPLANIVIGILVWMEIAKARNKPDWVGVLTIVPVIGFFIPAYLAFSD
ncbi:MAG: DUF5684 domain-containing protein [Candidatus Moranbacteria bacterium]|nr:DUF5684 domain-containing protein [Candidatus Moranbacteria bacterium]